MAAAAETAGRTESGWLARVLWQATRSPAPLPPPIGFELLGRVAGGRDLGRHPSGEELEFRARCRLRL